MDRRSFMMALFGGVAAASVGGLAVAEAAQPRLDLAPDGGKAGDAPAAAAIDETDAEFSQYYYRRRYRRRGYGYGRRRGYGYRGYRRRGRIDRRARGNSQR